MDATRADAGRTAGISPPLPITMEQLNTVGHMLWGACVDGDYERAAQTAARFQRLLVGLLDLQITDEAVGRQLLSCAELELDLALLAHTREVVSACARRDPAAVRIAATVTALTGLHCQRYPRASCWPDTTG